MTTSTASVRPRRSDRRTLPARRAAAALARRLRDRHGRVAAGRSHARDGGGPRRRPAAHRPARLGVGDRRHRHEPPAHARHPPHRPPASSSAVSLAVFALANVATAFAPTYEFALGTRVVAAVAHGVFWAIVIVYASSLLSRRAARARARARHRRRHRGDRRWGCRSRPRSRSCTSWRVAFAVHGGRDAAARRRRRAVAAPTRS